MTIIQTRKPKRVIQVFKNHADYHKEQNNRASREELERWNDFTLSTTGYAKDGRMLLNSGLLKKKAKFEACETLVLIDFNSWEDGRKYGIPFPRDIGYQRYFFLQKDGKLGYDIFTLIWGEDGYEIYLDYSRHAFSIGVPRRGDYKIANLKQHTPVRVSINGKHDFTGSGRLRRTFSVADYYFILLGAFNEFEFLDDDEVTYLKPIGNLEAKHVDLREILY